MKKEKCPLYSHLPYTNFIWSQVLLLLSYFISQIALNNSTNLISYYFLCNRGHAVNKIWKELLLILTMLFETFKLSSTFEPSCIHLLNRDKSIYITYITLLLEHSETIKHYANTGYYLSSANQTSIWMFSV